MEDVCRDCRHGREIHSPICRTANCECKEFVEAEEVEESEAKDDDR